MPHFYGDGAMGDDIDINVPGLTATFLSMMRYRKHSTFLFIRSTQRKSMIKKYSPKLCRLHNVETPR